MKEYHLSLQHEYFHAELALDGDLSLYDLAEFIIRTVKFDFDHAFEFCDNVKNPYQSKERYTLFADMGEPVQETDRGVKNTRISEVFRPRRKMIFHFDFGDDWFFLLTCKQAQESEHKKGYKKLLCKTGQPPVQYPADD
ncbi:MAG: hypothetical protein V4672_22030 [Verrucomicrobiota bacterium]